MYNRKRNASRQLITPRLAQAEVFEEIATMEFPFEGIPTIPPRKDMDHMVNSIINEDLDFSRRHGYCCLLGYCSPIIGANSTPAACSCSLSS